MNKLSIAADAFSHGQIKSKIWLSDYFNDCTKNYLSLSRFETYDLHWYGSWVGVGPFLLLLKSQIYFRSVNLYDLNSEDLQVSQKLLEYWQLEAGVKVHTQTRDINNINYTAVHNSPGAPVEQLPDSESFAYNPNLKNQIIINTSCEHLTETDWLRNLPDHAHVFLQSTDMKLPEHINCPENLEDFTRKYSPFINILNTKVLPIRYPNMSFNRYMLFGQKK
jgi:hypothetical protein